MQVHTFLTKGAFVEAAANVLLNACHSRETRIPTIFGLSGGETPKDIYTYFFSTLLQKKDCRIRGFLVDERYLPPTDPASNWSMIQTHCIEPDRAATSCITEFSLFDTRLPIEEAAHRYERDIQNLYDEQRTFDLIVLGIGTDGHTASLFPHSPALHNMDHLALPVHVDGNDYPDRLTMTFKTILSAKQLLLVAFGKEKRAVIDALCYADVSVEALPAKKLLAHPNLSIIFGET